MVEKSQTLGRSPMGEAAQVLTQANVSESRPVYEVGFHVAPTVGDDGVAGVVAEVKSALGRAEIISEQFPEKMSLAYTIVRSETGKREKSNEAYFGFIKFALGREALPAFQEALRANKNVLRYLVIETLREDISTAPRRAVFASDRLEGETIKKPVEDAPVEKPAEISQEEIDKSLDALVS
ncbi:MAG: 30S ribosomal protein S6 [Candidatus Adlerbacteria bacterium]